MIGKRLKAARILKDMKQHDVAQALGCAPTTIANWELGRIEPSLENLSKLCDLYEVEPLSLLDKKYSFQDIYEITKKPIEDRTYEEKVALTFSKEILGWVADDDTPHPDSEDLQLLEAYHALSPDERRIFLKMATSLSLRADLGMP